MKRYFSLFRNGSRKTSDSSELIRSLFSKFQMILDMNTKILEKMVEMERMSGGEYIFDKTFLENSLSEVGSLVYQVVYSLNAMTDNRFSDLFDTFQSLKGYLEDILAGGLGPYAGSLTLPYPVIRMEMSPLVGRLSSSLAELGQHMGVRTPDGFAVTTTCVARFMTDSGILFKIRQIAGGPWTEAKRRNVKDLVSNAVIPDHIALALSDEVAHLLGRIGKNTALTVVAETVGDEGDGYIARVENVTPSGLLGAFRQSLADCLAEVSENDREAVVEMNTDIAVAVHAMVRSRLSGTVATLDPMNVPRQLARVTVHTGDGGNESFLVHRLYPFDPVQSIIAPKAAGHMPPDSNRSTAVMPGGLRRGSSLIRKESLISLVESAMAVERTFGKPQNVHWAEDEHGRITIMGVSPLSLEVSDDISMDELKTQIEKATLVMDRGETAQLGVAAGRVVHVTEEDDFDAFPLGGIAVTRKASPHFSPVLRRASGLITETGSPAGHLAAIAREIRIPAIMGAGHALETLKEGMVITMDAGEVKVYQGILDMLVRYRSSGVELYPTDPEYITLRQLIRWIIPLNLTDPESSGFKSGNCKTFHDIAHFAHEMAVEELLNIQTRHRNLKGIVTRRLLIDIPMDIRVLDIGGGLCSSAMKEIETSDITSLPFKAFLRGIAMEDMWDHRPTSIGLREIFSGMDRTYAALTNQPGFSGQNLAIVAGNYLNLTLRLGYHFNVINAYLSENQNKNFIYYRFVGGFAYADRRRRRVEFISAILENMDFRVSIKGDLVIGKLKIAERAHMESVLVCLGELTGFTRQLDIRMGFENDVEKFIELFNQRTKSTVANRKENGQGPK